MVQITGDFVITEVKLKNWRSHWDSEFRFSGGTNVLIGVMGAGKSSLLDSMCFALFGTFPALQARKLTLDDVIMNRPQKKEKAEVELSFQLDDNVYSVKRVIERGKGTTKAEIRKNGTLIDTGSSRTTENVEKILKISYNLFSRAIYSEQNGLDNFLTIAKGQRMKKIDVLLRIDKFESARSSTTTLANRLKDNIKDKTRIITEIEEKEDFGRIEKLKKEISETGKKQKELSSRKEKISKEKEKIEKETENIKEGMRGIKEKEREMNVISGMIKNLSEDLNSFGHVKEKEIKERISKKEKEIEKEMKRKEKTEEKLKEVMAKESKCRISIEELVDRIENLKPAEGKCPVCNRKLTKEHKEKIIDKSKEEIKKREEELKEAKNEIKKLEENLDDLRKTIDELKEKRYELYNLSKRIAEYKEKKKKLEESEKRKREMEKEIEKERKGMDEEELEKNQKKLQELTGAYSEARVSMENNERLLMEMDEQLKELKEKKEIFENYRRQIKKMLLISEDLKKFEKALKETQITLRREFVDAVNFTMDRLWEYLYPYEDFTNIRLSIKEGDYSLELKESGGNWASVEGIASGGERTTACLALRIAFALVLAPNLKWLVLDEPTHNLDTQAVEYLAEVLRDRVGEFVEQVFLITHDEKLEDAVTGYLYKLERKREKNEPTQVNLVSSPAD